MGTEVKYGWVIEDQAAVIKGMSFGPGYLAGRTRCGPLQPNFYHNLIGKDVIFTAKGKHALREILSLMATMDDRWVRCGIREGMMIEKFVASEYGGGDDQIREVATADDIQRIPYHAYVFKPDNSYSFSSLVTKYGAALTGFIPGSGIANTGRELVEAIGVIFGQAGNFAKAERGLREAAEADEAVVLLTSNERRSLKPVVTHSHTHRISTIAGEIAEKLRQ